ncbi:putative ABC transport system permease protein [Natronobacillus azotifigens]|uniref:FtsX-like permease family protein n=1 Tax=Natronobacillus azotifigens TaxID=472978 RepID=A0A9J6RGM8_9BACI|nr:FtsX-like permease family protein [Natronobacillus azotifigens]MCZ0704305.1 FtsX-like permease family protein [Natronobacillus azotifigens]
MAKNTALTKIIFKEIVTSKARFLSILFLILLGVSFFAGLQASGPNMLNTANQYYEDQHFMDARIQSTLGLEEEDLNLLAAYEPVARIEAGYSQDVLAGSNRLVMRVFSYHPEQELNQYVTKSGRLPENSGEIALDNRELMRDRYEIGDTIHLFSDSSDSDLTEQFKHTEYTVVGFVNSPMYITEDQRGSTTVGRGTLDAFGVILEEDFDLPVYTDAYLTFSDLAGIDTYSDVYQEKAREHQAELERQLEEHAPERFRELREEIEEALTEAEQEIAEGQAELADAEAELDDAREQIEQGYQEIEQAEQELADAKIELEEGEQAYQDNLALFEAEIAQAEQEIEEAEQRLEREQAELSNQRAIIMDGFRELGSAEAEIDAQRQTLENQIERITTVQQQLESIFAVSPDQIPEETREEIIEQTNNIPLGDVTLGELLTGYFEGTISDTMIEQAMAEVMAELESGLEQLDSAEAELARQEQELLAGREALEAGQRELDQAQEQLAAEAVRLAEEKASGEAELDQAYQDLQAGIREYEEGLATLEDERATLEEAEAAYQEGLAEFEEEQQSALEEITEAEAEIEDARDELSELEEPTYYVTSREDNAAFVEYADNADRLSALATIFPGVFFAIAALVTLTTITRMIEEQRGEIGTLKALGYTNWQVSLKYYLYAILASALGTVLGLILGYQLFPRIIYNAYRILYNLPDLIVSSYLFYTLLSAAIALTCTIVTAWAVLRKDLKSSPSVLMRPKAPKIGKRILLERITPLWNRLNFIEKVTARNLFRYKQRMLMTVFGIAGCAALIVTGFGLKGAVEGLTSLQYGDVIKYDAMVVFDQDTYEGAEEEYEQFIQNQSEIDQRLAVYQESFEVREPGYNIQEVYLMVPETPASFTDFVSLMDRRSEETYELSNDGAIVTEKLADLFGLQAGDSIELTDTDNEVYQVNIAQVVENYTGHYLYLTEDTYQATFGEELPTFNADLLIYDQERTWEDQLSEQLTQQDKVLTTSFNSTIINTFDDSMESLNIVVVVLIISAAILAFIVLYNLTNINVSERIRELSTIKVLGFYDREVTMYIYRENIILTLMGIVVGAGIGRLLHVFVLDTASMDNMMFNPSLHWTSYVYAAILTVVFSTVVMGIMHRKLKGVDMIEALKSNE